MRKIFKHKVFINGHGFTLVEIVVVMGVLAVLGTIITIIFSRSLRGSNKAQILSAIKQNGQSVLEILDKNIRGADNVVCPPPSSSSTTLVYETQGSYTRYRFIAPTTTSPLKNGKIIQDNPTPTEEESQQDPSVFLGRICNINDIIEENQITEITDTNPLSGVSVAGHFERDSKEGFMDIVTVDFTVSPGVSASPGLGGDIDPVPFVTTITLR